MRRVGMENCHQRQNSRTRQETGLRSAPRRVFECAPGTILIPRGLICEGRALSRWNRGSSLVAASTTADTSSRRLCASYKRSEPDGSFDLSGSGDWRRPTFAHPRDALSSGLQRFTSVFGMGTGGTTALGSPEGRPHGGCRIRHLGFHFRLPSAALLRA